MKKIIYISTLLLMTVLIPLQSQVTIGSNKSPESYSVLEMDSKEGGLRLNQLDESNKEDVTTKLSTSSDASLTRGLTIFNTEANKTQYWDGNKWAQILSVEANEHAEGVDGQFLMSNGNGKYPEWVAVNMPKAQKGELYMYSSAVKKDMKGADLPFIEHNYEKYDEDIILNVNSMNWVEIKDLETTINIPVTPKDPADPDKVYSRLVLEMQTGAQMEIGPITARTIIKDMDGGGDKTITVMENSWISFTIGIFIGNNTDGYRIRQVRSFRLDGAASNSFNTFTLIGAVDNLPAGEHTIKVAVKRRTHPKFMNGLPTDKTLLTVGKPFSQTVTNYNNFMAQSFLRADLYIVYD